MDVATFGAGCFWQVEEEFRNQEGVLSTKVGYSGGHEKNPTYEKVCEGDTGHAECVHIHYNPHIISYEQLLGVFWKIHDPTTLNRQGADVGSQYRSVIFYHKQDQKYSAEQSRDQMQRKRNQIIVTSIEPFKKFYPAEEYHQKYIQKKKKFLAFKFRDELLQGLFSITKNHRCIVFIK